MNSRQKSRRPRRLRGKGDYSEEVLQHTKPLPRLEAKVDHIERLLSKQPSIKNAASSVGRTLGSLVGQGDLGALAGSGLAKLFGHGDYTVKTNSLVNALSGPTLPKFGNNGRGIRVREREFIGDVRSGPTVVSGSTPFNNTSYEISPQNSTTFPWLSQFAENFEQWEPHGIVFEFISTSSEYNGLGQALGTVIMATDYDPNDPPYGSKPIMENADYSCSTKPSQNLIHGIECDPKERPIPILYTKSETGGGINNLMTMGNFQVATQGMSTSNVTLGELWVSYDISFYKKQIGSLYNTVTLPFYSANYTQVSGAGQINGAFTAGPYSQQITITQNVGVGSVINFNNVRSGQKFLVCYRQVTTNTSDSLPSSWALYGCTRNRYLSSYTTGTGSMHATFIVEILLPNATITTGTTAGNHVTLLDIDIVNDDTIV